MKNWLIKLANDDLPYTSVDSYGRRFETGVPVEFGYLRNTEKSPDMSERFQQHIEPAGRYITHNEDPGEQENWETGTANFEHPLVIKFNATGEALYDENSWKALLSKKFGNKTGESLSNAIVEAGYDGIVTVSMHGGKPLYVSEIVDLRAFVWELRRDGVLKHRGTEASCYGALHRKTSGSWDWAMKYEGWTINPVSEDWQDYYQWYGPER